MSLTQFVLPYALGFLAVVLAALYFYFTRNFGYWKKKGIEELKPLPFVGNLKDVALGRKNVGRFLADVYEKHKKSPFIGFYSFDEPALQVHDLDIVKSVLVKDGQNFCDRGLTASEKTDPLAAKSLFGLKGERWKLARNALTPSFTSGKIKGMYELVKECGKLFTDSVAQQTEKATVVYEVAARYTTDCIATCAFGIQGNALKDPNAEFRKKLRLFFEFGFLQSLGMAMSFFSPKLVEILGIKILPREGEDFVRETVTSTVAHRVKHTIHRGDFLDCLIELRKEQNKEKANAAKYCLEEEELLAHSMAFLTAGFETSATTISYSLYELALNQDVQDRLRREILGTVGKSAPVPYETLHSLKYLSMVLQEVLRKYPPLPNLDRVNIKPYTIPNTSITLKAGTKIAIPLHAIQMDPDFFPNPKKFDPERFSDENKNSIINYSYMPFGEGPRICAGKRFALMQVKSGIVDVLRKFSVHPTPTTPKELEYNPKTFLLQPKEPFALVFRQL